MKKMLLVLILLAPVFCAEGKIITVDDDGTGADFRKIQDAIDDVGTLDGDTIVVKPGTYNENIRFNRKAIRLTSQDPDIQSVVETTNITAASGYSVRFDFGETGGSMIIGFTITGRGIYCYGTSPMIAKNIIKECTNNGITGANGAAPTILSNTITSNSPTGISACRGLIAGNTITHNGDGGGMYMCFGDIIGNEITNNTKLGNGGAMYQCGGDIIGNVITDNQATSNGGAIFQAFGRIEDNIIVGNKSGSLGGGLYNCSGGINHNIIAGNQAQFGGGLDSGGGGVYNNTIVGNRAQRGGGVSYCTGSLANNIIAFNEADETGGVYGASGSSYNSFWANAGGNFGGASPGPGDAIRDPCFAEAGYWDPNGTAEDTDDDFWVDGDYHLKSEVGRWDAGIEMWVKDVVTSRCIDEGDPLSDWYLESWPYSGELWPHGGRINAGRYGGTAEASMSLSRVGNVADLNLDGLVDFQDMMLFAKKWPYHLPLLREDLDRDGGVDLADYAVLVANWQPLPLPTPNPMTWDIEPQAISDTEITMTATVATSNDGNDVEYYFDETSGNPGGSDSGWQSSNTYTDAGLDPGIEYSYRVQVHNKGNHHLETGFSEVRSATTLSAPTPDPMVWAADPCAVFYDTITMTAAGATSTDGSGVEYYFEETSGNPGGSDSNWQDEPSYTDTDLSAETAYCYKVKARNKGNLLETEPSAEGCVTTGEAPRPTPSPMTWLTEPYAVSANIITMVAGIATSSDGSGVQYFFDETSGNTGGTDSGWQDSPSYADTGLSPLTQYSYKVKVRNKGNSRETEWSPVRSATTPTDDTTPPSWPGGVYWESDRIPPTVPPEPHEIWRGGSAFNYWAIMEAAEATDNSGFVEYKFECLENSEFNSNWQLGRYYEVWLGRPHQGYSFRVKARDKWENESASPWVVAR